MAKADLGLKRTCLSCGMRFYDFNRAPIVCPGCQTEFDPEAVIRSRRGRVSSKDTEKGAKAAAAPVADEAAETNDEEEVAATESSAEGAGEDEAIGFNNDDIDADNDDSAGLISDDLDEDEEILPGIPKEDE